MRSPKRGQDTTTKLSAADNNALKAVPLQEQHSLSRFADEILTDDEFAFPQQQQQQRVTGSSEMITSMPSYLADEALILDAIEDILAAEDPNDVTESHRKDAPLLKLLMQMDSIDADVSWILDNLICLFDNFATSSVENKNKNSLYEAECFLESREVDDLLSHLKEIGLHDVWLSLLNKFKTSWVQQIDAKEAEDALILILHKISLKRLSNQRYLSEHPMICVPLSWDQVQLPKHLLVEGRNANKSQFQLRLSQFGPAPSTELNEAKSAANEASEVRETSEARGGAARASLRNDDAASSKDAKAWLNKFVLHRVSNNKNLDNNRKKVVCNGCLRPISSHGMRTIRVLTMNASNRGSVVTKESEEGRETTNKRDETVTTLNDIEKGSNNGMKSVNLDNLDNSDALNDSSNDSNNNILTFEAGVPRERFYFHSEECLNLRKYKEAIRQLVFEDELRQKFKKGAKKHTIPPLIDNNAVGGKRLLQLFQQKETTLVIDKGDALQIPQTHFVWFDQELQKFEMYLKKKNNNKDLNAIKSENENENDRNEAYLMRIKGEKSGIDSNAFESEPDGLKTARERGVFRRQRRIAARQVFRQLRREEADSSTRQAIEENEEIMHVLPQILKNMDVHMYGTDIWYFIVEQLSTKDRPALWKILEFVASEQSTSRTIDLLEQTKDKLTRFSIESLDELCLVIIESSRYPVATSLYLGAFIESQIKLDISRADELQMISAKYMEIAIQLLQQIESDHLLAMILEIPSDIHRMSIWEIAITYKLDDFLDFHRLQPIVGHLWNEPRYLDPSKQFDATPARWDEIMTRLYRDPKSWYYSPMGLHILSSVFYFLYVILITIWILYRRYTYDEIYFTEVLVWMCNGGYVLFEIVEFLFKKKEYFFSVSNYWDMFISFNWIVLFVLRFVLKPYFREQYLKDPAIGRDNKALRNSEITNIYMGLLAIQCVLLWTRLTVLLQRDSDFGPLIQTIMNMIVNIFHFSVLLLIFLMGFVVAVYYISAGDVQDLDSLPSVFLYIYQTLLGQQDWEAIESVRNDEGAYIFNATRSRMVESAVIIFGFFGSILLLNLLIAIMASSYSKIQDRLKKEVNFNIISHTFELANKNALMPPPFNIFVLAFTLLYLLLDGFLNIVSVCRLHLNQSFFHGIDYSLFYDLQKIRAKNSKTPQARAALESLRKKETHVNVCHLLSWRKDDFQYSSPFSDSSKTYCRFCRNKMIATQYNLSSSKNNSTPSTPKYNTLNNTNNYNNNKTYLQEGNISDYFELFKYYQLLDEDDKKLLRNLLTNRRLCPHCYRPFIYYHGNSNRLHRWQVLLELMSYFLFRTIIRPFLLLILFVPALVAYILHYVKSLAKSDYHGADLSTESKVYQQDPLYVQYIRNTIEQEELHNFNYKYENAEHEMSTNEMNMSVNKQQSLDSTITGIGSIAAIASRTDVLSDVDENWEDQNQDEAIRRGKIPIGRKRNGTRTRVISRQERNINSNASEEEMIQTLKALTNQIAKLTAKVGKLEDQLM